MPEPRYTSRKLGKYVFAPAVAVLAAPSRAEITAGTVLMAPNRGKTVALTSEGLTGWESSISYINTPDGDSDYVSKIRGEQTSDDTTMIFYDTPDPAVGENVIRTALAEGTNGFMILMHAGDVPGRRCQVWTVQVASVNDNPKLGNEANTFTVGFATTAPPEKVAVVPAAT